MATLDDIKSVLDGIRSDLGSSAGTSPGVSAPDMAAHTEALRENTEAMEGLHNQTRDTSDAMDDLGESAGNSSKELANIRSSVSNLKQSLFTTSGQIDMLIGGLKKMASAAVELATNTLDAANKLNGLTQGIRQQTGATDALVNHIGRMRDVYKTSGVQIEEAAMALETLMRNTTSFTMVSNSMQASLMEDAVILQEVGVSFEDFSSIVEVGTRTLGMGADEASDMVYKLRASAIDLQLPVDTLMHDMPRLVDGLASMGDRAFDTAIQMMKLTKETGISHDALTSLDSQMATYEGATKFAAQMNQALDGSFFNPHELMQAYNDGPAAVAELTAEKLNQSGMDFNAMSRRHQEFLARQAEMSVPDFKKLVTGQMGALDDAMGKTSATQAAAAADAQVNMKSHLETAENLASVAMELPIAAAEREMRNLTKSVVPYKAAMVDSANAWAIQAAEAKATEMAMAGMLANEVAVAAETPAGKAAVGAGETLAGALLLLTNLVVTFSSKLGGLGVVWTGLKAKAAALTGTMVAKGAALATFAVGAANSIYKTYENVTKVIKAGGSFGDQMIATGLSIMQGFGQVLDFLTGGFLGGDGFFSALSRKMNPGGKSFLEAYLDIDWGYLSEGLDESMKAITEKLSEFIYEVKDIFGIASPSKVFIQIGSDMVAGLAAPFLNMSVDTLLEPIMEGISNMVDIIPEPLQEFFSGDASLGDLAAGAVTATSDSLDAVIDAVTGNEGQQQIALSFELDGREVDKKILNVVGGVVQPLLS